MKVFFSYARADSDFALKLSKDMRSAGAELWIDQLDIQPGERWDEAVENALKGCPCLLIVLSPAAVASDNVLDEVAHAIDNDKKILPVLYQDCDIPFRLKRFQHVNFTDNYERAFHKLLESLASSTSVNEKEKISASSYSPRKIANRRVPIILAVVTLLVISSGLIMIKFGSRKIEPTRAELVSQLNDTFLDALWKIEKQGAATAGHQNASIATNLTPGAPSVGTDIINLLSPQNGGHLVAAPNNEWLKTLQKGTTAALDTSTEGVYAFKDGRAAVFDTFALDIEEINDGNVKDFELLAGSESANGPFHSIGKFQTQNVKMFDSPYQKFTFAPTAARYLKLRVLSAWNVKSQSVPFIEGEIQLWGILK